MFSKIITQFMLQLSKLSFEFSIDVINHDIEKCLRCGHWNLGAVRSLCILEDFE